jgi:hypothetical protein
MREIVGAALVALLGALALVGSVWLVVRLVKWCWGA